MKRIVDLSLTLHHGMRGVEFAPKYTVDDKGWNATTLSLYSHSGTHMDAPVHYNVSREGIDSIPLEHCMGPAHIVDVTAIDSKGLLTPAHVQYLQTKIKKGDGLIFKTGWSAFIDTPQYREQAPGLSPELVEWCVLKGIRMLGIDTPSVSDVNNIPLLTRIHKILLAAGIIIVEGLANLDALEKEYVFFMAIPLKLKAMDGSPVRAFAIENDAVWRWT